MQIRMQNAEALTGPQMDEFLKSSEGIDFTGESRAGVYAWTERLLVAQEFAIQGKKQRGAIRRYASKVTGLGLPQMTRLIRGYGRPARWSSERACDAGFPASIRSGT
jgi:hypothetical protein